MIVDDDPILRRLIARRLQSDGFHPVETATIAEAMAAAETRSFEVAIVDHQLPDGEGLEVMRLFQSLHQAPEIVYVTALEDIRLAVTALKAGAADYIVKSPDLAFIDLLAVTLEQVLARVEAAEALKLANRRLIAMLDEVNHRVSNSLQIVSSLVGMQERQLADPTARAVLALTQTRIQAIAQVHHCLYTGGDVSAVDIAAYLDALVERLHGMMAEDSACPITLEAAPLRLPSEKAVAIGIIVLELVTNACKYAYPNDAMGPVRVRLAIIDDEACVEVEDDGVGLPATAQPHGTGLGMRIVATMMRTLGGRMARPQRVRGLLTRLTFPIDPCAPESTP